MTLPQLKTEKFTYADYLTWDDSEKWEIIEGMPYNMSPAPYRIHQDVSGNLFREFSSYLKDKKCKVYSAPFDVRLSEHITDDELIQNVVQPDISIFCDMTKLDKRGAIGAPDLIVEILSVSTFSKDMNEKLRLYRKHRVKEYWIVDPDNQIVMIYTQGKKGMYKLKKYTNKEIIQVGLFPGLNIDLSDIF